MHTASEDTIKYTNKNRKTFTLILTDLLLSESCPDNEDPKPDVVRLPSPGPAVIHRGSELELGLDFGLSTNTEEEAESLRKLCLTGEALGVLE